VFLCLLEIRKKEKCYFAECLLVGWRKAAATESTSSIALIRLPEIFFFFSFLFSLSFKQQPCMLRLMQTMCRYAACWLLFAFLPVCKLFFSLCRLTTVLQKGASGFWLPVSSLPKRRLWTRNTRRSWQSCANSQKAILGERLRLFLVVLSHIPRKHCDVLLECRSGGS
jgi:hypothetical protein